MRRFVVLDEQHQKVGEGVEQTVDGAAYIFKQLTHRDGSTGDAMRSFGSVDEIVGTLPVGHQVRFLDWHTTDEAFKLVKPGDTGE